MTKETINCLEICPALVTLDYTGLPQELISITDVTGPIQTECVVGTFYQNRKMRDGESNELPQLSIYKIGNTDRDLRIACSGCPLLPFGFDQRIVEACDQSVLTVTGRVMKAPETVAKQLKEKYRLSAELRSVTSVVRSILKTVDEDGIYILDQSFDQLLAKYRALVNETTGFGNQEQELPLAQQLGEIVLSRGERVKRVHLETLYGELLG